MNRQEALREVALNVAALMTASAFSELTGVDEVEQETLPEADEERLLWAVEEVQRRLRAMGQPRQRRFSTKRGRTTR